tara:strand:+ start:1912 stop:2085 length:174 start_codon:yes stop_codon:yes gene_type:complete
MDEILQAIEELEDMLIKATGGELSDDWRVPGQDGESAFCAVILNPLSEMREVVYDLL